MVTLGELLFPAEDSSLRSRFAVLEPADRGAETAVEEGVGGRFGAGGCEGGFGWGVVWDWLMRLGVVGHVGRGRVGGGKCRWGDVVEGTRRRWMCAVKRSVRRMDLAL